MKRIVKILPACIVAVALFVQFSSCEKYILPAIAVKPDTLVFQATADTIVATITSTVQCTVDQPVNDDGESVGWASCDCGEFTGKGEGQLTVYVTANASSQRRNAIITINSEAIKKKVRIIQTQKENE